MQAKYKNYKEELADSTLINIAYDYFMKQDNPQRKAMVLYYKGVLYEKADKKNEVFSQVKKYLRQEQYVKKMFVIEKEEQEQIVLKPGGTNERNS